MNKYLYIIMIFIVFSCSKNDPVITCDDNILNGTETGIDCGGDCEPCFTCMDGILNGEEIDIDCGGPDCSPCTIMEPSMVGIWQQITHTENGVDLRAFYNIENVFYEFKADGNFTGLTVQENNFQKLFNGNYNYTSTPNKLVINNGISNSIHVHELTISTLKLTYTNPEGNIEIQTLIR